MKLLNGRKIALEMEEELRTQVARVSGRKPCLAFILVGDHPASKVYVRAKQKACSSIGIESRLKTLPATTTQEEVLRLIHDLNRDDSVDGILVQLPLPLHINDRTIMLALEPTKDVDGFHPMNVGKMLLGEDFGFLPCTPHGIQVLLQRYEIPVEGKKVVIVGRSNIVGKPLAAILMQKRPHCNATVTIAHSLSEHLPEITRSADILVAAIGKSKFITKEMVRPGAVVIDVGINRTAQGTLIGDVDFEAVAPMSSWITPVPGGVGPMTIAMLMQNTWAAFNKLYTTPSC